MLGLSVGFLHDSRRIGLKIVGGDSVTNFVSVDSDRHIPSNGFHKSKHAKIFYVVTMIVLNGFNICLLNDGKLVAICFLSVHPLSDAKRKFRIASGQGTISNTTPSRTTLEVLYS
jgi:hypothetical protein